MRVIEKPREGEYPAYAHIYIDLLPDDGLILKHLADNHKASKKFVLSISKDRSLHRCAEGKWTINEILGHIVDDERIYVYRALRSRHSAPAPPKHFWASGFCQPFSRSTDCVGSHADRGHTGDREFARFRALEVASGVSQEDAETIQPFLTRRSPVEQVLCSTHNGGVSLYRGSLAADSAVLKRNEEGVSASGNWLYWFFCSLTACAFSSSAFCQLALGLYSFIDLATTSVFLPRSF